MVGFGCAADPRGVAAAQGEGHVALLERDGRALQEVADLVAVGWLHAGSCYPRPTARTHMAVEPARPGHSTPVRIATFNILHGRSLDDGRVDVDRLAAAVKSLDADVLGLQEVDRDQPRSFGADLTAVAAEAMGAPEHQFVAALHGHPRRHVDGRDRRRAAGLGHLRDRAALPLPRRLLAGGAAAGAAGQRAAVVAQRTARSWPATSRGSPSPPSSTPRPAGSPSATPTCRSSRGGTRAAAPPGALARRHPRAAGPHGRPQHGAAAGGAVQRPAPRSRRRATFPGTARAAARPRAGAGRSRATGPAEAVQMPLSDHRALVVPCAPA